jgi:hypothetical protein
MAVPDNALATNVVEIVPPMVAVVKLVAVLIDIKISLHTTCPVLSAVL